MSESKTGLDSVLRIAILLAKGDDRKELWRWLKPIIEIRAFGEVTPGREKEALNNAGRLAKKLRSGEPVPAAAAMLLAELLDNRDGSSSFRLAIAENTTLTRSKNKSSEVWEAAVLVHKITSGFGCDKMNKSNAVEEAADQLGISEKTIWRWLKKADLFRKNGLLPELPDLDDA
jgi:hypothetical protein